MVEYERFLERLADTLRFGAPADGPLDTHIVEWWQNTDAETKRATFATIFDRIEVGADYFGLASRYGFPPSLIRLPFTSHKRTETSRSYRELGFGATPPAQEGVGNSNPLRA